MKLNLLTKKIILSLILCFVVVGIFSFVSISLAQDRFGVEDAAGVGLGQADLRVSIVNIIRWILGFLGIVALVIILYGGFLWMTSGGDANKIAKAKKTLISAVIGLIIILSAFTIASFIINAIGDATGLPPGGGTPPILPPTCNPICPSQFTYINEFKDESLSWSRRLGPNYTGVASIPPSSSLEVGGYAKNSGGGFASMEFYTAALPSSLALQSMFLDVPTDAPVVSSVYAPWDSSSYSIASEHQSRITALLSDSFSIESRSINNLVRPVHCFNGVQDIDEGETGIDCGGACGACGGGTCEQDSDCANGVCIEETGLCAIDPFISSLEPADGAPENYITIWGSGFGEDQGQVDLIGGGLAILDLTAECADIWSDNQIIFAVPDVPVGDYRLIVSTFDGLVSNEVDFEVNDIERPGVCLVDPNFGINPDEIAIWGNNFPGPTEGEIVWSFSPSDFSSLEATFIDDSTATDVIPASGYGKTSIRVYNSIEYSNYINFFITAGGLGDPCGDSGASVCAAASACQPGLACSVLDDCTCQVTANPCEAGFSRDCDTGSLCVGTEVCPATGTWDDAVCVQVDSSCDPISTVQPATQSIFAWAFVYGGGYGFEVPKIVEDCSRSRSCGPDQKLPSPSPWYEGEGATEGWDDINNPRLYIEEPRACTNSAIYARFTEMMDDVTVENNVFILRCDTKFGENCIRISGDVEVSFSGLNDVGSYFRFNSDAFSPDYWYKVVLTQGVRSIFNVEMVKDQRVVDDRYCDVNFGTGNTNDAVYCWNFQTRVDNTACEPGCPECGPDPERMNWYYQNKDFTADLVSDDNVCLTLDARTYDWDWSSGDEDKLSITNDGGKPLQTATALDENYQLRPNYTKINSTLTLTGQNDYCRVTNDFTNPIVIESKTCDRGLMQSPTPWINSRDAGLNSLIGARFSRDMNDISLTLNTALGVREGDFTGANGNIIVEECDSSDEFNFSSCTSIKIAAAGSLRIFTYTQEVDVQRLLAGESRFGDGTAEGFIIDVNAVDLEGRGDVSTGAYLTVGTWYRVVILGGPNGVGGADNSGDGIPDGVLLTENSIVDIVRAGWDYNNDGFDDYYWFFKTGNNVYNIDKLLVTPSEKFIEFTNVQQEYDAFPQAENCNILARCFLDFTWRSLIELGDAPDESGDPIASISKFTQQVGICGDVSDSLIDPVQTATTKIDGEVKIQATEPRGKSDYGNLQVGFGNLLIIDVSPRKVSHFENRKVKIDFNLDADLSSIHYGMGDLDNVRLYECNNIASYYPLDGNANNESPRVSNASEAGRVNYVNGKVDEAVRFRGEAGTYIENDKDKNPLRLEGSFTVMAWVKPSALARSVGQVIAGNYSWNGGGGNDRGWSLGDNYGCSGSDCTPVDELYFQVCDNAGSCSRAIYNGFFQEYIGQWVHVVGVFEPGRALRLYINGELAVDRRSGVISAISYHADTSFRIGHRADSDNQGMWNGLIDEFRAYNRSFGIREVRQIYSSNTTCPVIGLNLLDIDRISPEPGSEQQFARKVVAEAVANYAIDVEHRVVVDGGPGGVLAWNGNELTNLNFNSTGFAGGEECEPGLYPWAGEEVCLNNAGARCLLDSRADLCTVSNGRFAECDADSEYCSSTCHNEGNTNLGSCGDGVVSSNEECDDSNADNNDGCSSSCLWEGSNAAWGSLCGNGRLEYGESCDDNSADCDANCLNRTGRPSGSDIGVPVCGNNKVEEGEDCDNGNSLSGDGCSSSCLFEGSTGSASCGNDLVEVGQYDTYSWTYDVVNDPPVRFNINNCTNGIWDVRVSRGEVNRDDIFLCRRDSLAFTPNNIFGRAIDRMYLAISKVFGFGAVASTTDGCGSGYGVVEQNLSNFSDILEYMADDEHVFAYIPAGEWELGKNYKINIYEDWQLGDTPYASAETLIEEKCVLSGVKVDIWPRGEEKYRDTFFCVGNDCGQSFEEEDEDLYDNDVSAFWNVDATDDYNDEDFYNYDFPYIWHMNALTTDIGEYMVDPGLSGNQHLYQVTGVNEYGYYIKIDDVQWDLIENRRFDLSSTAFSNIPRPIPREGENYLNFTSYKGDVIISLNSANIVNEFESDNVLYITLTQAGYESKRIPVDIKVFLCENPWPEPANFPYADSNDNCINNPDECPDMNFELYYCRDRGNDGVEDDLPSLEYSTVVYQGTPFKKEFLLQRGDSKDAVGVRVVANNNHYSPLLWYNETFDPSRQGSPSSTQVDGYEATIEGRTVYASSVNIEPGNQLYSNVYLISYSEGADKDTQEIYTRIANRLNFNTGSEIGSLSYLDGGTHCSGKLDKLCSSTDDCDKIGDGVCVATCSADSTTVCLTDEDCALFDAGYCLSDKAKLTRDTKRLGDLQDTNYLLDSYFNTTRCSNDQSITCVSSVQCFGGGTCGTYYPSLPAGTYIAGRSFSVWPSWNSTLGNALGSALPVDPLNEEVGFVGCESTEFDEDTCWDDITKTMACPSAAQVYAYFADGNLSGFNGNIIATNETPDSYIWQPADWNGVRFMDSSPFVLDINPDLACNRLPDDCGNFIHDDGEDCANCPFDVVCSLGEACLESENSGNYTCVPTTVDLDSDGDGYNNTSDNCPFISNAGQEDFDGDGIGDVCDNCVDVRNGSRNSIATCLDIDGDGTLDASERGGCNQNDRDNDGVGDACDNCLTTYNPNQDDGSGDGIGDVCATSDCGSGYVDAGETCDDGDDTNAGPCNSLCTGPTYCGDGFIQGWMSDGGDGRPNGNGMYEECDDGGGFSGDGCSSDCKIEEDYECDPDLGCFIAGCGNGIVEGDEVCDCGQGAGPLPEPSNCGDTTPGILYTSYNIPSTDWAALDFYFNPFWRSEPEELLFCSGKEYGDDECKPTYINAPTCGDGVFKDRPDAEECEWFGLNSVYMTGVETTSSCSALKQGSLLDDGTPTSIDFLYHAVFFYNDYDNTGCDIAYNISASDITLQGGQGDYYLEVYTSNNNNSVEAFAGLQFNVDVLLDGAVIGSINPHVSSPVPEITDNQLSAMTISNLMDGDHTISFRWNNDFFCDSTDGNSSNDCQTGLGEWVDSNFLIHAVKLTKVSSLERLGYGLGFGESNQYSCSTSCQDSGGWLGDRIINGPEECDGQAFCDNTSGTWESCPPYQENYDTTMTGTTILTANGTIEIEGITACDSLSQDAGKLYLDLAIKDMLGGDGAAVVFVNDLSGSMSATDGGSTTRLIRLKQALLGTGLDGSSGAIHDLFEAIPDIQIGSVNFSSDGNTPEKAGRNDIAGNCPGGDSTHMCDEDDISQLVTPIREYGISDDNNEKGTFISAGLERAHRIINETDAKVKIIILMSDGAPTRTSPGGSANTFKEYCGSGKTQDSYLCTEEVCDTGLFSCNFLNPFLWADRWCNCTYSGLSPSIDGNSAVDNIKDDEIFIYSLAFGGADATVMRDISSDTTVACGSASSQYCYTGSDLGDIYSKIVENIVSHLSMNLKFTVGGKETVHPFVFPSNNHTHVIENIPINLPDDFCVGNPTSASLVISGIPGDVDINNNAVDTVQITFSNPWQAYCPILSFSSNGRDANGTVAGDFEEVMVDRSSVGIISLIKSIILNLFGRIFSTR